MRALLFRPVDAAPLIFFRLAFGLLCFLESIGAIFTGWVYRTLIEPQFTFSFIGFEWLQPLPGWGMYAWYVLMGVASFGIMVGYRYRLSAILFAILWTGTYLMQKTEYNNHYYLVAVLSVLIIFLPADSELAFRTGRKSPSVMPNWIRLLFLVLVSMLYTYAAINKVEPDWLGLKPVSIWFANKTDFWLIGPIFETDALKYLVAYGGVAFDLSIAPMLLWRRTRIAAVVISTFFHLFNSITFGIGIFPYLMLAFSAFYFPPAQVRKRFFPKTSLPEIKPNDLLPVKPWIAPLLGIFLLVNLLLPLRHHLFPGNVSWTEEGHRLSWRMMLRSKWGMVSAEVLDADGSKRVEIDPLDFMTRRQMRAMATRPDMIWTFAQRLDDHFKEQGYTDPQVFVTAKASLNGRKLAPLIDHTIDLSAVPWTRFQHKPWILPMQED